MATFKITADKSRIVTGLAGELRAYWSADGQIIEGDVNGDKKADFSIEIFDPNHALVLTDGHFML